MKYIKDNEGKPLEVTNLKLAIKQAALFLTYHHENPTPEQLEHDLKYLIYWKDIHTKLTQLRDQKTL